MNGGALPPPPSLLPLALAGCGRERSREEKEKKKENFLELSRLRRRKGERGRRSRFLHPVFCSLSPLLLPPPFSPNPCGSRSKNEQLASNLERRPFLPQVTALWLERARGAGGVGVFFWRVQSRRKLLSFLLPFLTSWTHKTPLGDTCPLLCPLATG